MVGENKNILLLDKPFGLTPLATLDLLRQVKPEYNQETLSYAGRLDPMATGLMLVLVGETNKDRERYLSLDKTYDFEILFGFQTDTGDLLGKVIDSTKAKIDSTIQDRLEDFLKDSLGTFGQEYPKYSSPLIDGKKSFTKTVTIYSIEIIGQTEYERNELKEVIISRLKIFSDLNPGNNFRQSEIISDWENIFQSDLPEKFLVFKVKLKCSSGTYIRALVDRLGLHLGLPAVTFSIHRTMVGDYDFGSAILLKTNL